MKKFFAGCLLSLIVSATMAQNTLEKLDLWVVLEPDGSGIVGEERHAIIGEQGTEGYIAFNNMEDMQVVGLAVDDEDDEDYIFEEEWNIERSREEKARRCGFHRTDEGVEICWGLGKPGERTYNIYYKLTNLVQAFDDYDGFCYSFYEAGTSPAKEMTLHIVCHHDSLTLENAAVWAFGFEGYKAIRKGRCEIVVDGPMKQGEAVIILLQLQKGLLNPVSKVKGSFTETVKRKALEGSDYDLEDAGLDEENMDPFTMAAPEEEDTEYGLLIAILAVVGIVGFAVREKNKEEKTYLERQAKNIEILNETLRNKKLDDLPYYRNPPLGGNLLLSGITLNTVDSLSYFLDNIPDLKVKFKLRLLYEALILRLIYKGQIQVVSETQNGKMQKLFRISEPAEPARGGDLTASLNNERWRTENEMDKNEAIGSTVIKDAISENRGLINDAGIEYLVQSLLYAAAGQDHLLQPKELEDYMTNDANCEEWRPLSIVLDILAEGTLKDNQLKKDNVTQVVGFMRYLKDFSLVGERNLEETALWKEYLVFAAFYGIADKVSKDMKKVAPDVASMEGLLQSVQLLYEDFQPLTTSLYSTIRTVHSYQTASEKAALREKEVRRERSRSSGGSGRSSYRGGGGHRGGGGSGFR